MASSQGVFKNIIPSETVVFMKKNKRCVGESHVLLLFLLQIILCNFELFLGKHHVFACSLLKIRIKKECLEIRDRGQQKICTSHITKVRMSKMMKVLI